jgi:hypothetical protein
MDQILSVAGITSILVVLITFAFQYFPVLRVKWGGLASNVKMLIVLALYLVIGAIVGFGGCVPLFVSLIPNLMCTEPVTFFQYAFAVLAAIGSGQGVFSLLPELNDVTMAKAAR